MNDLLEQYQRAVANLAAARTACDEARRKYVSALEFYQTKLTHTDNAVTAATE